MRPVTKDTPIGTIVYATQRKSKRKNYEYNDTSPDVKLTFNKGYELLYVSEGTADVRDNTGNRSSWHIERFTLDPISVILNAKLNQGGNI